MLFKAKFITINFSKNESRFIICFEDNWLNFQIKNEQNGLISDEIIDFIKNLLSLLKDVELLFSRQMEHIIFEKIFLAIKESIKFITGLKSKEIEEEEYSLENWIKEQCSEQSIKYHPESYRSILTYLIRRFYFESQTFLDPTFFDREITKQMSWREVLDKEIDIQSIEDNTLKESDIKKKFVHIGLISFDPISSDQFFVLRHITNTTTAKLHLVIHNKTFKLLVKKTYEDKNYPFFEREKENFKRFDYQHPNVLKHYGFNEDSGFKSIFIEFMSNGYFKNIHDKSTIFLFDICT